MFGGKIKISLRKENHAKNGSILTTNKTQFQMSRKANRNTAGKSRKSSSESTKSSSQNIAKGNSGYDFAGRIRKCCISWHECVQKWGNTNSAGLELATKIVNEKLQNLTTEQDGLDEISSNLLGPSNDDDEILSDKEALVKNFDSLKDIHKKLCSLTSNFQALTSLQEMKEGAMKCKQPIFETWSLENYVSVSGKLACMFEQELRLKEKLVAMVLREATLEDRSKLMACLAMWLHQPYLDHNYQQELELMLIETGLRTP